MESAPGYWSTSTLFKVEAGEDEETNPYVYGRQLAGWLREKFLSLGYPVEEVIPEDWGWCVMCQREPYRLWIGCVNLRDHACAKEGDPSPAQEMLRWNAVPAAERPFFKYLFRKRPSMTEGLIMLASQFHEVLRSESSIQLVDGSIADTWFARCDDGAESVQRVNW